jgi:uncharacterized cupredoxin-like copper-binding protein
MSRSLARGIGIGLVLVVSGFFLSAFVSERYPGFGMFNRQAYLSHACSLPSFGSGQTIEVSVYDTGMMMGRHMGLSAYPATIVSGKVNILVANVGMRTHEVVILPLATGQVAGERTVGSNGKVDESGSLGEVSNNCAPGSGEGILAGSRGWNTLNLAPGRYEFLCNLRNHYSAGMYQEIVVTG